MPKFKVHLVRISYQHTEIEVEAETALGAEEQALEEAGDHDYSESNADYEVESVTMAWEFKLCPYHQDSLGWDTCSEEFQGCQVKQARKAKGMTQ